MSKKIKSMLISIIIVLCSMISIIGTPLSAATISGNVSYLGMTSTGKFWVWASTAPLFAGGSDPIVMSSYVVDGNDISFQYTLYIPDLLLPRQIYVYAVRDWHPPFIDDFLTNPQQGQNPIEGDPIGELKGGVIVSPGSNLVNLNIIVVDPPQGQIRGTIYYDGNVYANSVLKIAVTHGMPQEGVLPVKYQEWNVYSSYDFPFQYTLMFLPDATDYYVAAILDDKNNTTPDPYAIYGPITISDGIQISGINLTLSIQESGGEPNYGNNTLKGSVTYSGSANTNVNVYLKVGFGDESGLSQVIKDYSMFGLGMYEFKNLPDGIFYISVFMDLNNNGLKDLNEPSAYEGPISLSGGTQLTRDIQLTDQIIEISTISVTIRGKVLDKNYQPLGGVKIFFNRYRWI